MVRASESADSKRQRGLVLVTTHTPIADALVLVFTPGVSLDEWRTTGLLEREWSLYERLATAYSRLVFVTWGGSEDREIGAELSSRINNRLTIVAPGHDETTETFRFTLGARVRDALGSCSTAVVKTNQMQAGSDALAAVRALRASRVECALIARGGFLWSRFAALEHGAASRAAQDAAAAEQELCSQADLVVGTTPSMTNDLAWRFGLAEDRLTVIPNYVRCPTATRSVSSRVPTRILFAGRFAEQKRIHVLIEAVSVARTQSATPLTLRLIGSGPLRDSLAAQAQAQHVPLELFARVPHAQLMDEMSTCGVYAQTSAYEGHPKTVLEAMAHGAPTLVTDTPGLGEVVRDGQTGLRVADDVAEIAAGLLTLVQNRSLADRLGTSAREWIHGHFSLERVVELELAAHRRSLVSARQTTAVSARRVRFDPSLVHATTAEAVATWQSALDGYTKRLTPRDRAVFLAALDAPVYEMQGRAAIEAEGGLHPKHRLMRYHDFFVDRIKTGERVIDLGCGVGALACAIAQRSEARVVGMDWSQKNLDKAKAAALAAPNARTSWELGDITQRRAAGSFDAVVLSNVLEHLQDRASLLVRFREWYQPSRFLIRVPAFDREWRAPWKRELGVEWRLDPTHETEFTEAQLHSELAEAGLRVTELIVRWGEYWCVARSA